ncbi:MAG: hypothetical protein R3C09_20490 [Pirellulaceae bacterium]|jgi:hypothetical protein
MTKANNFAAKKGAELVDGVSDVFMVKPWKTFIADWAARVA